MKSFSLLTDSLRHFPPDWQMELFQFMESPVHNRQKQPRILIRSFFHERNSGKSIQETDDHIRNHFHRNQLAAASKLVRSFLAWKSITEDQDRMDLLALGQLRKLEADKAFTVLYNRLSKSLEQRPLRNSSYYFKKFQLEDEANGMFGLRQTRIQDQHLSAKIASLDEWYITTRMKESIEMQNRSRVLNQSFEDHYEDEVRSLMRKALGYASSSHLLTVYRLIGETITLNLPEDVHTLIGLLDEVPAMVDQEEARGIYKHAQNACIRQINAGRSSFQLVLLELYQSQLESGLMFSQGFLQHTDVKNITTVAIRLGHFAWGHQFLEEYSGRIHPRYRENVYAFSKASLLFEEGQLHQAVRLLQEITFTDVFYDLSARHLLLRMYIQLEDWEGATYGIQAFEVFIRRNKNIPGQNRQAHLHFARVYKKLLNWKERKEYESQVANESRHTKLQALFQSLEPIAQRDWLKGEILQSS